MLMIKRTYLFITTIDSLSLVFIRPAIFGTIQKEDTTQKDILFIRKL